MPHKDDGDTNYSGLHHLDSNEMLREKARWELHKNAACHFEQILLVK